MNSKRLMLILAASLMSVPMLAMAQESKGPRGSAQTMEQVLRQCGDDLTRANIMKQAASLNDFTPSTLMPGIKVNTSATDFAPIEQLRMMQFKNGRWVFFGDTLEAATSD